jgi:hypothetical protein
MKTILWCFTVLVSGAFVQIAQAESVPTRLGALTLEHGLPTPATR